MPVHNGPISDYDPRTNRFRPVPAWQTRGPAWWRTMLWRRRNPGAGTSYPGPRREWGGWTVRPGRGWRQIPWITPPLHYTRSIPANDEGAALNWALERLGIGA